MLIREARKYTENFMKKKNDVAIVHYNTPELTEAAVLSLRKHGGVTWHVTILDNSDKKPFTKKMDGVTVVDNTNGQIVDFEKELAKYPKARYGFVNGFGSDKHMMSVQALWDILPDGFLLMDSDVLIKANVEHLFRDDQCAVGHLQNPQPYNNFKIPRLVPMLCYINVPMCRKCGLKYFDPERAWMIHSESLLDKYNWYDTGASFYEDIHNHVGGARGRRIDIRPLMEHFKCGSWGKSNTEQQKKWLQEHRDLWVETPRMRGIKKVAICAIGRNENRYAVEWVEHYKKIGVSKIFVYDNYFEGETPLAETLKDYVKQGFVEIEDVHGRRGWQCRAYEDCYQKHGDEYAWIGFLDFDEFLRWKGRKKIDAMFERYTDGDAVLVNWRTMTDNGLVHYDDRPLAKRFTKAMEPLDKPVKYTWAENDHCKCFLRGGLGKAMFKGPHNPSWEMKVVCVNGSGKRVKNGAFVHPFDHSVMRLDHYYTKTAEEWIHTKLARGYCSGNTEIRRFMKVQEDYFFAVNERTEEKEKIVCEPRLDGEGKPFLVLAGK